LKFEDWKIRHNLFVSFSIVSFIPDSVLEVNIKVGDSLSMINGIKK